METVIHIEDVTIRYGKTTALSQINFDVEAGEFLGIMGPNGGGKTTLLKAILGLIPINYGKVEIIKHIEKKKDAIGKDAIGYVPQFALMEKSFPITALEVVLSGGIHPKITPFFKYKEEDKENAYEKLRKVGLKQLWNRQISQLSGGEFQRLLIARALASHPQILLLDEPTASVDATSREQIYNLLEELNEEMTIVLVTHDLFAISSKVKKIACLNETLVYHGEPQLNDTIVNQLYGCPVDLIAHGVPHRVLKEHKE